MSRLNSLPVTGRGSRQVDLSGKPVTIESQAIKQSRDERAKFGAIPCARISGRGYADGCRIFPRLSINSEKIVPKNLTSAHSNRVSNC